LVLEKTKTEGKVDGNRRNSLSKEATSKKLSFVFPDSFQETKQTLHSYENRTPDKGKKSQTKTQDPKDNQKHKFLFPKDKNDAK